MRQAKENFQKTHRKGDKKFRAYQGERTLVKASGFGWGHTLRVKSTQNQELNPTSESQALS